MTTRWRVSLFASLSSCRVYIPGGTSSSDSLASAAPRSGDIEATGGGRSEGRRRGDPPGFDRGDRIAIRNGGGRDRHASERSSSPASGGRCPSIAVCRSGL